MKYTENIVHGDQEREQIDTISSQMSKRKKGDWKRTKKKRTKMGKKSPRDQASCDGNKKQTKQSFELELELSEMLSLRVQYHIPQYPLAGRSNKKNNKK